MVAQTALPHRMGAEQAWDKPEEQTSENSMSRWEDFQIASDSSDSFCAFISFSAQLQLLGAERNNPTE